MIECVCVCVFGCVGARARFMCVCVCRVPVWVCVFAVCLSVFVCVCVVSVCDSHSTHKRCLMGAPPFREINVGPASAQIWHEILPANSGSRD